MLLQTISFYYIVINNNNNNNNNNNIFKLQLGCYSVAVVILHAYKILVYYPMRCIGDICVGNAETNPPAQ